MLNSRQVYITRRTLFFPFCRTKANICKVQTTQKAIEMMFVDVLRLVVVYLLPVICMYVLWNQSFTFNIMLSA